MLLTGCLDFSDAYRSIEWRAIFLIAGMWPLSLAIRSTGLAINGIQAILETLGPLSPLLLAALLVLIAFAFTQFMGGQVSSLVIAPLAIAASGLTGVDPRALGMAVALGCSVAFPTPFGHPVNIMVLGPGGYTSRDFLRVGTPLTILAFVMILAGLFVFWNL
jgi:di/tricarboxylate transporter